MANDFINLDYIEVPNYEGLYAVTKSGELYSFRRKKILIPFGGQTPVYTLVDKYGKRKRVGIRTLLCATWFKGHNGYFSHKNKISRDFAVNNLIPVKSLAETRLNNNGNRKPVKKTTLDIATGEVLNEEFYSSIKECAELNHYDVSTIAYLVKGKYCDRLLKKYGIKFEYDI